MAPVSRSTACSAVCARCVRPSFHLGDRRVRIVRVGPVVVRALLRAGPVEPGQLGARRGREAGRLGQPGQKRVVALARIPPHNAPHRRIGVQRRGIDPHRAPHHQRGVGQSLQHPGQHCLMGLEVNQATGARQRRVVRRGLVEGDVQKCPDAQRIGGAPRDCPFRVQPFEVAEQQQPDIPARRQTRPADPVRVERRALCLHERIEPRLVEHPIQPLVKRVPSALRQIRRGHPHCRLLRSAASCPHRHARQCSTRDRPCRSL